MILYALRAICLIALISLTLSSGWSARVYVLSCGNATLNNAVVSRLEAGGHTVTLGVAYTQFNGTQDLSNIDVVYLQPNHNFGAGDMPLAGQGALLNFLSNPSKGLVTCEWTAWKHQSQFAYLRPLFAVNSTNTYRSTTSVTFNQEVADPIMNAGLPNGFTTPITVISNAESFFTPKSGATVFYRSNYNVSGNLNPVVTGWRSTHGGRVLHFGTVNGLAQINDANFGQLLSNAMTWASSGTGPAPDVLVMSSHNEALDRAVVNLLEQEGMRPYVGANHTVFYGTDYLNPTMTVIYMQMNHLFNTTMPDSGQTALLNWLSTQGRGLVTSEWILWADANNQRFAILRPAFAAYSQSSYRAASSVTYSRRIEDPILDDGVPSDFTTAVDIISNTESAMIPKPNATRFTCTNYAVGGNGTGGVIGWNFGTGGRVMHFSTVNGPNQVADSNFGKLLANAIQWARSTGALPSGNGDVNRDGCVNDEDLLLILFNFGAVGCLSQDLDGDGRVSDNDLLMVLFAFGQGC